MSWVNKEKSELALAPTNWKASKLSELAQIKSGDGITSEEIYYSGDYPCYGGNGLRGWVSNWNRDGEHCLVGRQGALCGNVKRVSGRYYASEHAIVFEPKQEVDPDWLHYRLDSMSLNRFSESSAQPGLAVSKIASLRIALPSLTEQKKIGRILLTWDKSIEATERLLENSKKRKKALMQQLLTGKKRLPGFEDHRWITVKANTVFKTVSIKRNSPDEPLLAVTQDQGAIPRDMLDRRVVMPDGETSGYKLVVPGNFIISLRSFQGGLEFSRYRGLVSPAYTILDFLDKKKHSPNFFRHYFKSYDFIGHLAVAVIGIRDGKQISYDDFSFLRIPAPSIEEQEKIASFLDTPLCHSSCPVKFVSIFQHEGAILQGSR